MGKVLTDTASLTAVADAIREKSGGEEALVFPEGFVAAVAGIVGDDYEVGYTNGYAECNAIFNQIANFSDVFYGATFPEGAELELDISRLKSGSFGNTFRDSTGLKSVKLYGNNTVALSFGCTFWACNKLELVDLSECNLVLGSQQYNAFYGCNALREIKGVLDFTDVISTNSPFPACYALETVTFAPNSIYISLNMNTCYSLSDASIQSIIDGLADLTDGTAQVLSLHTDVKAKLTEAQLGAITAKNWSVA